VQTCCCPTDTQVGDSTTLEVYTASPPGDTLGWSGFPWCAAAAPASYIGSFSYSNCSLNSIPSRIHARGEAGRCHWERCTWRGSMFEDTPAISTVCSVHLALICGADISAALSSSMQQATKRRIAVVPSVGIFEFFHGLLGGSPTNTADICAPEICHLKTGRCCRDYKGYPSLDGIVLSYDALPGGDFIGYDQGKTLVHETGVQNSRLHSPPQDALFLTMRPHCSSEAVTRATRQSMCHPFAAAALGGDGVTQHPFSARTTAARGPATPCRRIISTERLCGALQATGWGSTTPLRTVAA